MNHLKKFNESFLGSDDKPGDDLFQSIKDILADLVDDDFFVWIFDKRRENSRPVRDVIGRDHVIIDISKTEEMDTNQSFKLSDVMSVLNRLISYMKFEGFIVYEHCWSIGQGRCKQRIDDLLDNLDTLVFCIEIEFWKYEN